MAPNAAGDFSGNDTKEEIDEMRRTWIFASLMLALALVLSACGGGATPTEAPAEPTEEMLSVALLTSGTVTDEGWNQTAYEGLLALQEEGYEIANTESVAQADQLDVIRNYANQDFDVIVGHGFEYGDALTTAAEEFPDKYFIQVGGIATAENLASYVFEPAEGGYLSGVLASYLSESGNYGFVGAVEIPTIAADEDGYRQAVLERDEDASVVAAYTGSWTDIPKAKEAALAQISSDVDMILANGDNANVGAIEAAEETGDAFVIGWTRDQSHLAPEHVAMSIVQRVDRLLLMAIEDIEAGTFEGKNYVVGAKEEIMAPSDFGPMVPEEAKEAVMETYEQLQAGEIDLPEVGE